jgi:drug/metabolite transporter (DMT)-like permease
MRNKNFLGTAQLLLAAFIWGSAFVAQSKGMDHIGPLTFASIRFLIGGVILIPLILIKRHSLKKSGEAVFFKNKDMRYTLLGGILCGILLTVASVLQQYGLLYTSVGKAGFITTLYVIMVPIFGVFMKKRIGFNIWFAVIIALVGLYLLCMTESLVLSVGDTLVFCCALAFTAQIVAVDIFVKRIDAILLSCMQFLVVGVVAGIPALFLENPNMDSIMLAAGPILYAGVLSSGVAFTLQVVAQRYTEPTLAAITMSFESVFAVLSGWVILSESLTMREIVGCAVMFGAIILAQLPSSLLKKEKV